MAVVTTTLTTPAACAGVTAVRDAWFALTTTLVAAVPPTLTPVTFTKLVPVTVIVVPPEIKPVTGVTADMVGGGTVYVNALFSVAGPVAKFTTTLTRPAACAGVTAVIWVEDTSVTPVAGVPPTETLVGAVKFAPVIVIVVPPVASPVAGDTLVIDGLGAIYVKAPALVADCASGLVTTTSVSPAACAGAVAVMEVGLATVTFVANVPPTRTVAPATKFVPLIVSTVPPAVGPLTGETALTVGAGRTSVYDAPLLLVRIFALSVLRTM